MMVDCSKGDSKYMNQILAVGNDRNENEKNNNIQTEQIKREPIKQNIKTKIFSFYLLVYSLLLFF